MKRNLVRAMTQVEVILLATIVSLFAMAAVPSFLESRIFSDVARAKRDLKSLAVAMESYCADNTSYPSWTPFSYDINNRGTIVNGAYTVTSYDISFMSLLTTPVAYISAIPRDVFRTSGAKFLVYAVAYSPNVYSPYGYVRHFKIYPRTGWMTFSFGPDRISNSNYFSYPQMLANEALAAPNIGKDQNGYYIAGTGAAMGMRYDPTNGMLSYGDLYHFGGDCKDHLN